MMKQILLAAMVGTASISGAQTISTAEPEFSGMIVYADSTAAGQSLETTTLAIKTKGNASLYVTGIGKATSYGVVKGKPQAQLFVRLRCCALCIKQKAIRSTRKR